MNSCLTKDSVVNNLVSTGFSKEFSEELYRKYADQGKVERLNEYANMKSSISERVETIPLRDI